MSDGGTWAVRKLTKEEMDIYVYARAQAYNIAPWIAHVLWTLQPVYAPNLGTFAVDEHARIYLCFDQGIAKEFTKEQYPWLILHEASHWLRRHTGDRGQHMREHNPQWAPVWFQATDMEINDDLMQMDGVDLPDDGGQLPCKHGLPDGWIAEKYAEELLKRKGNGGKKGTKVSGPSGGNNPGGGQGDPGDDGDGEDQGWGCLDVSDELKEAADAITEQVSEGMRDWIETEVAKEITKEASKNPGKMPSGMKDWAAEKLTPPKIDWRKKMRRAAHGQIIAVRGNARDSYNQPNRRNDSKDFILPGRRAVDPNVLIGLDVSGSMLDGSLDLAVSETTNILRARNVKKIRVMEVDVMASEAKINRGRKLGALDAVGGGTDMSKAYYAIREMPPRARPSNFILLTDGYTPWPGEADVIPGVYCLAGIIADCESTYNSLVRSMPSWIIPIYIPKEDLEAEAAAA